MRVGISTASFYPMLTEKALQAVVERGVPCTEIFFNAKCELEPHFVDELARIKSLGNTDIVSIHPTMSLAESFMLFSAYDRRLYEGLDEYKRYGEVAAMLGARYVIMHGGKPNGVLNDEQYCERFLQISEAVAQNGAMLLQENVNNFRAGNLEFLKKMAEILGDKVNFCLDVKQSIRGGYTAHEVIKAVGKHIRHLHISDNNSERDCLLPLNGSYDFNALFNSVREIGYEGDAVIEVYSNAYQCHEEIFESLKALDKQLLK